MNATTSTTAEVATKVAFDEIRYAQAWEDADVLLAGLATRPGDTCVSIAAAGDNALALLVADPASVVAIDLSAAQLACTALRIAMYRSLDHAAFLELLGARASDRRPELYARCRKALDDETRAFWDARPRAIAGGVAAAGKLERYFALFRDRVLPLIHDRATVAALFVPRSPSERACFYRERWNTHRWRWMFAIFFSRFTIGRFGRDPRFFDYVTDDVSIRLFARVEHALVTLDPSRNSYLRWILTGRCGDALPLAWRAEHFATIRARIDRVTLRRTSLEAYVRDDARPHVDRWNLSDVFEYVSPDHQRAMLDDVIRASRPKARLAYWNMLVPRSRPEALATALIPRTERADALHATDLAFFYRAFVLEDVA